VISKLKDTYILWQRYFVHLPKTSKYSLGEKIDRTLLDAIEMAITAAFLQKNEKIPYVRLAIRKVDTVKILLLIAWETRAIDDKKYADISVQLDESGKMLGGWYGQLTKSLGQTRDKENPARG
jgi:hypothetical protein